MSEFGKFECACDLGYDKGALKKTIENNIFTIFGNLNQKNSIVIRYHGQLTENDTNNSTEFSMFYYFDDHENDKKIVKLHKCCKCIGDCYCATIDLNTNHSFCFGFLDSNNNSEINGNKAFELNIAPDPISNIMQRYGFEQNINLPTCEINKETAFFFQNILAAIKGFFSTIFKNSTSI